MTHRHIAVALGIASLGALIAAVITGALTLGIASLYMLIGGALVYAVGVARAATTTRRAISVQVTELLSRQRRDTRKIADIAGSIGRMAPRVRHIERRVAPDSSGGSAMATPPNMSARPSAGSPVSAGSVAAGSDSEEFSEFEAPARKPRRPAVRAATILDEFSALAFAPEWTQIPVTPSNWRSVLDHEEVDLLFVESAWNGNEGAWLYHIVGPSAPRQPLIDLVAHCQAKGIPTIFWNKEDPPHFEDFLVTARLFDVVLTTDVECVPRYVERLGHDRVYVLPFAAQARIHNPARVEGVSRDKAIGFGGMYFRHKYPERRAQLDYLLPAAVPFGLDIFSRHSGGDANYQFPEPYDNHVRGALTYRQMLTAYRSYRAFINVNSVVGSPSMCARRIFEITASGGAVVTPPSPAVDVAFPNGEVPVAVDINSAQWTFKALLHSEEYRRQVVHLGQRQIWREHTYTHRVGTVLEKAGVSDGYAAPSVSVIVPTVRPESLDEIVTNVGRQSFQNRELVICTHGFEWNHSDVKAKLIDAGVHDFVLISGDRTDSLGKVLNRLVGAASGDVLSKMDDDDYYGAHYLEDLVNALYFSEAEVVGKAAAYVYFESKNATAISYEAHEHRYTNFVRGATLTASRDTFLTIPFGDLRTSEDSAFLNDVRARGGRIYAADKYNFAIMRRSAGHSHTWRVEDDALFAGSRFVTRGFSSEMVSV